MNREPVEATPRRAMTPKRRQTVLAKFGGCCAYPGCELTEGLEIDHTIPLEIGGRDDLDNLQPLCRSCHARKTAQDIKIIAKARRLRKREDGTRRERKPIQSQPLTHPTLKRNFDGTVSKRTGGNASRKEG